MMKERRNRPRHIFELHTDATITLIVAAHCIDIVALRDTSPFGIGLLVDAHLKCGCEVSLQYRCGTDSIDVFGTVVWSAIAEAGCEQVGIFFDEQKMATNVEFFNALTA